ncbi:MAG: hypothetical protein F8N37_12090 [Telmatospirillum sp.]|nr:hypothetical protein [Telmatospirillum sp.]
MTGLLDALRKHAGPLADALQDLNRRAGYAITSVVSPHMVGQPSFLDRMNDYQDRLAAAQTPEDRQAVMTEPGSPVAGAALGFAAPLYPEGLAVARAKLETMARRADQGMAGLPVEPKPAADPIGVLTDQQFQDLNAARQQRSMPPFNTQEVFYDGNHHYNSRVGKDGLSIDEILQQIQGGMAPESRVSLDNTGPSLRNPSPRVDEKGNLVNDKAVFLQSGNRPTLLFSTYARGRQK